MDPFRPGKIIGASALNRVAALAERAGSPATGGSLETLRSLVGNLQRVVDPPGSIWARVTGTNVSDPTLYTPYTSQPLPPGFCYSGFQELDDETTPASDFGGGIAFLADTLPLVEITGNTGVQAGTLVRAYPGDGGNYYTFDGDAGTCALPASAQALADASPQGPDAWTNLGTLLITLTGKCCHWAVVEQRCALDGTHPEYRWNVVYFSQPIKVAVGPWETTDPPPAWFPDCPAGV